MLDLAVEAEIPKLTCWPEIHRQQTDSMPMAEHYSTLGGNGILPAGLEIHFRGPMKFGALGQRISGHGGDEIRVLGTRILDGKRGANFVGVRWVFGWVIGFLGEALSSLRPA